MPSTRCTFLTLCRGHPTCGYCNVCEGLFHRVACTHVQVRTCSAEQCPLASQPGPPPTYLCASRCDRPRGLHRSWSVHQAGAAWRQLQVGSFRLRSREVTSSSSRVPGMAWTNPWPCRSSPAIRSVPAPIPGGSVAGPLLLPKPDAVDAAPPAISCLSFSMCSCSAACQIHDQENGRVFSTRHAFQL
jgi:hypothetical protein